MFRVRGRSGGLVRTLSADTYVDSRMVIDVVAVMVSAVVIVVTVAKFGGWTGMLVCM